MCHALRSNVSNLQASQSNTTNLLSNIQSELFTHDTLLALHSNELADNVITITNLSTSLADNSSRISSLESSSAGGLFTNTITSQRANGQAAALYARDTNNPDRADNVEYNYVLNAPRPGDTQGGIDLFINSANRTSDGGPSTTTLRNGHGKLRLGYTLYDTVLESNVAMNAGKIVKYGANGTYLGSPTNSTHGGNGTRFVLWPGTANTAVPYGMGMESAHMWFSSPGGHRFYTGTTAKMTINGNGVGIGTSAPTEQLHVYENLSTSGHQICGRIGGHTSSYNTLVLGSKDGRPHIGGHRGDYGMWADLSLQNDLIVLKQSNMSVGINQISPAYKLDVIGDTRVVGRSIIQSTTTNDGIVCTGLGGGLGYYGYRDGDPGVKLQRTSVFTGEDNEYTLVLFPHPEARHVRTPSIWGVGQTTGDGLIPRQSTAITNMASLMTASKLVKHPLKMPLTSS